MGARVGVALRVLHPPGPVEPGNTVAVAMRVANTGVHTDRIALVPVGLAAGWVAVDPPVVTVLPDAAVTVVVHVRVPPAPLAPAGPFPVVVRAVGGRATAGAAMGAASGGVGGEPATAVVDLVVVVAEVGGHRVVLGRAPRPGRRRGRADVFVTNVGNTMARIDLAPVRPAGLRLIGDEVTVRVDPRPVVLEPGATTVVGVRLSARRRWAGGAVDHPIVLGSFAAGRPGSQVAIPWRQRSSLPSLLSLLSLRDVLIRRRTPTRVP